MNNTNAPASSFRLWLPVGLLWVVACLNYLDRNMLSTMGEPIKTEIHMTDEQYGLLMAIFLWVYGLLSPVAGYLADRFSRRGVIIVSLVVWSLVTWLTGHAQTFHQLLWARALMGVSEACYIPAALALISDYHRGRTRSLATGLHMSGVYAGAALGGLGGVIAQDWGWRTAFNLFGLVGMGYGAMLLFSLKNAPDTAPEKAAGPTPPKAAVGEALAVLLGQPAFWMLLALNSMVGVSNWGINSWLPTYLKDHFKLGLGAAGMSATAYIQVASFVGVLVGGIWADRWSRSNPRGRALVPAWGYLLAAPFLYLAATTNTLGVAICGLMVLGLGRGFFDANLMPIVRQVVDERYSATGYGVQNMVSCLAGGIMVYVGGWWKKNGVTLDQIFIFSAAGLMFTSAMLFIIRPKNRDVQ